MQAIYTHTCPAPAAWTPAALLSAMEVAASHHAYHLNIHFDRLYHDFGALWMIVRSRYTLERQPVGPLHITTWMRSPTPALSIRDFDLADDGGPVGQAVQTWVIADAQSRRLMSLRDIPPLWTLPYVTPERSGSLRTLRLPELPVAARWTVQPEEIDDNGHLNNVQYVRHAQAFAPADTRCLEIIYDRECFVGERITLEAADGYVRGVKPDGTESFRAHFHGAE